MAVRSKRTSPPSTRTRMRLKSVVPPPTSQTRTSCPSLSCRLSPPFCAAIHA